MKKLLLSDFRLPASIIVLLFIFIVVGCKKQNDNPPFASSDYVVFASNSLGMHCLNPTYDEAVILPPYNTVLAQVVKRGNPPVITTSGITVEYKISGNTSSYGKRQYGGFWDHITALFGMASLQHDIGLTGNGLSGAMTAASGRFEATGIPVVPVNDQGVWDPLQVAEITVKDGSGKYCRYNKSYSPHLR